MIRGRVILVCLNKFKYIEVNKFKYIKEHESSSVSHSLLELLRLLKRVIYKFKHR